MSATGIFGQNDGREPDEASTGSQAVSGGNAGNTSGSGQQGAPAVRLPQIPEVGLTSAEVQEQVAQGNINRIDTESSRSLGQIIRENVFTLFNAIIFVAMVLVLLTGQWKDAVFGLVIIINSGIGVFTEMRAKHTLDKLSILIASKSLVRRDGRDMEIEHEDIVLGDLLWLRSGEQVPADATIVHTWGLELDESMLTGESRTVKKGEGAEVYSGSNATSGMALVRVDAVGENGYAAKLTAKAKVYKKTVSDLSKGINTILKVMTVIVIPLCILLVISQIRTVGGWQVAFSTGAWRSAIVSAVAGVVGMIPEGLVLLTSLNFAIAAMRLARQHTLVQELESVETLARVDALNLDKTGTITDGGIVFNQVVMLGEADTFSPAADADIVVDAPSGQNAVHASVTVGTTDDEKSAAVQALYDLSNEENPNGTGEAVLKALNAKGVRPQPVDARVPFSSARKWSAIVRGGDAWYMGAPEMLLSGFEGDNTAAKNMVAKYANQGMRVLLLARASGAGSTPAAANDFADTPVLIPSAQPVALVLCSEHIRDDAEETLAWFREQGVRCRIISGDSPATVGAIARTVKLTGDREPVAMDARELPSDVKKLSTVMENVDVLGRVLPEQKKAIVDALHESDHVVAMTGDGVNDALALKEADLGIAMGNAAPATKAVAQVVLVDSKFSHLPSVVARGRQVMANMERVSSLFLVKTVYSALISLGVVCTFIPFPYLPRHITYIGALTIGIPAFILALAPNNRRYIPGFLGRVVRFALPGGIAVALSVLLTAWALPGFMNWNLSKPADLLKLRDICAIIVFVLGILVMARVAQPLNSWRGVLVAGFALAGLIGMFIPIVSNFFELVFPTGWMLVATIIVLALSIVIFAGIQTIADLFGRLYSSIVNRKKNKNKSK
ncbi:HAD-IC family P-type ATPase [Bifidobacterium sp. ESL0745]|uniref:HAD-IC family P-type ATPase n=1 Tax=Bifidobacterium sp. ESL0745 TaxID=2983226 RepID=UPI0023F680B6|nr:HAD-IC family P-type ATPase [Bifidobacterium sp. ESL0745]MDF7664771.1 HAD-IC family P-type ATPase [Bifidobacterium sp. ESL0745]